MTGDAWWAGPTAAFSFDCPGFSLRRSLAIRPAGPDNSEGTVDLQQYWLSIVRLFPFDLDGNPGGDCDDTNLAVNHGATEIIGNSTGDDYNGAISG